MQKLKLAIIIAIFTLYSLFFGIQTANHGTAAFAAGFFVPILFSAVLFLFQSIYFIRISRYFVHKGADPADFGDPLDIWLIAIPLCVLMMISYLWLNWHIVEVFYCTTITLTGMLFGNGLGRGSKKWDFRKSVPFFFGVIWATVFALVFGGMM